MPLLSLNRFIYAKNDILKNKYLNNMEVLN